MSQRIGKTPKTQIVTRTISNPPGVEPRLEPTPSTGFSDQDLQGDRSHQHAAPVQKGTPESNLLAVREAAFSRPPEALAELLFEQVEKAAAFAERLSDALSFFGGARVKPGQPHYAIAQQYGEALLLANAAAVDPGLFKKALRSGLFSPSAVKSAQAVVISLAQTVVSPAELAHAYSVSGGDAERLAAALVRFAKLPELSLRPRTGAGPGIMHAVAEGYVTAREKLVSLAPPSVQEELRAAFKAQGSRMGGNLPFEQKASDAIEEMGIFLHFIPRRLALTEGAPAFPIFPGGIGTLNEMFEVMRADRLILCEGRTFWGAPMQRLAERWEARGLVEPHRMPRVEFADGPEEGLPCLLRALREAGPKDTRAISRDIEALQAELRDGPLALAKVPPAVTFLGGRRLTGAEMETQTAGAVAGTLAASGTPLRVGGPGALFDAVHSGNQSAGGAPLQAFLLQDGTLDVEAIKQRALVGYVASSPIAHKPLMYENTLGLVVAPGGVGTMDELFEIACLISTGNAPERPIVLIGRDFWQPLVDAFERVMDPDSADPDVMRAVKAGEFKRLLQIVDTKEEVMAALVPTPSPTEGVS